MENRWQPRRKAGLIAVFFGMAAVSGLVPLMKAPLGSQPVVARRPTGAPQLISYAPLPAVEGAQCEWIPASASGSLLAAMQQERAAGNSGQARLGDTATRAPLRAIRDPYASYSSVAVDPTRNEVVMTDENLFSILVYDRTTNTPPSATMSEPKRMIAGLETHIEFQCGLYIDPGSGDIYAVNNDTVDKLVIFSRQARGNVPPDRLLETPHGTFGIAVAEQAQELFLTVQHDAAIVVYKKMAQGEEAPIRLLQGNRTRLADPHGIAIDEKNGLLFVTNHGSVHEVNAAGSGDESRRAEEKPNWPLNRRYAIPGSGKLLPPAITVYRLNASGNTPPLRVIEGPKTQMNWPTGISFDPERNEIVVANDAGDAVLVFDGSASGDAAPIRILKGPKSLVKNPTGVFVDVKNDEMWVTNFGNHTAAVYKRTASGDAPPLRVIRSAPAGKPALMIGNPGAIAYDTKREEVLVPN
jgi:DNA-binding beta-propeller fold protein YncE